MSGSHRRSFPALASWLPAIALACFGGYVLWDAIPGINWGIWTLGIVSVFHAIQYWKHGRCNPFTIAVGLFIVVIAFGSGMTTREELHVLAFLAAAVLLSLMMVSESFLDMRFRETLFVPIRALRMIAFGTIQEISDASMHINSPKTRSVLRALCITVPVVGVLILLLANADPIFAAVRHAVFQNFPDILTAHLIFGFVLLVLTLGIFGSATRAFLGGPPSLAANGQPLNGRPLSMKGQSFSIGHTERAVLLWAVAVVMWLFVISAVTSLLANPAATAGSGITYAEYARRGFVELSVAATLVVGVVLVAKGGETTHHHRLDQLMVAALLAVVVILSLAFARVIRYEMAYGYTEPRVYAQVYMVALFLCICALIKDVWHPLSSRIFFPVLFGTAVLAFTTVLYWNVEGWVVNRNVDRYLTTGKLDVDYLYRLSYDALPALDSRSNDLTESQRQQFWMGFAKYHASPPQRQWFEWNVRWERAEAIVEKH